MENQELSNEIEKALLKIQWLSIKINRDTDMCVFINVSGHVSGIEITISESKKNYNNKRIESSMYFDKNGIHKDSVSKLSDLNNIVEFMEECLKNNCIDYKNVYPVYEQVVSHYEI
ncbi:hypothetical protein CMU04_06430 [Elizabethkingia anophelis]|nr:hypothetical protein [Elizabethkingia anophelis]